MRCLLLIAMGLALTSLGDVRYAVDEHGLLSSVSSGDSVVSWQNDDLVIETDVETCRFSSLPVRKLSDGRFCYEAGFASFTVGYETAKKAPFVKRSLEMTFSRPTVLKSIMRQLPSEGEAFLYHTFWNASSAAFVRSKGVVLACGFENPYCRLSGQRWCGPS